MEFPTASVYASSNRGVGSYAGMPFFAVSIHLFISFWKSQLARRCQGLCFCRTTSGMLSRYTILLCIHLFIDQPSGKANWNGDIEVDDFSRRHLGSDTGKPFFSVPIYSFISFLKSHMARRYQILCFFRTGRGVVSQYAILSCIDSFIYRPSGKGTWHEDQIEIGYMDGLCL